MGRQFRAQMLGIAVVKSQGIFFFVISLLLSTLSDTGVLVQVPHEVCILWSHVTQTVIFAVLQLISLSCTSSILLLFLKTTFHHPDIWMITVFLVL